MTKKELEKEFVKVKNENIELQLLLDKMSKPTEKKVVKKITTKNDLYVKNLENIGGRIKELIKEVESLNPVTDGWRFDQIQNTIGHLEKITA
jgi:hypothetical protein